MTFSKFHHSSPLFKSLNSLKFSDITVLLTTIFMYKVQNNSLPFVLKKIFISVSSVHHYNTRLAKKKPVIIFSKQGQTVAFLISDLKDLKFGTQLTNISNFPLL